MPRELSTELDRRFALLDVTTQQTALLSYASSGRSSPSQLMDAIGTDTAGMTRLLDRLEAKGLVRRRPNSDDRRSVLVEPTDRGLALVPELAPVFGQVTRQLFDGFSDAEIAKFTSFLRRMRENLQPSRPPAARARRATFRRRWCASAAPGLRRP